MAALACERLTMLARSGASVPLPGPTGENNVYAMAPHSGVLCLACSETERPVQLAAVLAVGSRVIWPATAQDLLQRLPASVQAHIALARERLVDDDRLKRNTGRLRPGRKDHRPPQKRNCRSRTRTELSTPPSWPKRRAVATVGVARARARCAQGAIGRPISRSSASWARPSTLSISASPSGVHANVARSV